MSHGYVLDNRAAILTGICNAVLAVDCAYTEPRIGRGARDGEQETVIEAVLTK